MVKIKRLIISSLALVSMVFVGSTLAANGAPIASSPKFNPQQVKSIQKIIHNYLIKNPEVLLQASVALRKKMKEKQQSDAMQAIQANKQTLFNDANSPTAGNPNGNIMMVEFFDYQCPHCKTMNATVQNLIKKNSDLKVIFKEWPIFGGSSLEAAKAAIAANMQGKYFEMHDALLAAGNPMTKNKIFQLAKKAGLNIAKLKKNMDDPKVMQQIKANFDLARKLKLVGTPAFVLTNKAETTYKFIPGQTTEENLQKIVTQLK